ncbi:hypothetical protein GQ44DRAFT_794374 [Phaeosphaeriaceae sp. PMI808]|nr:hypothetical protein GQ44DRAFT_794374 [Phaeosphaeriaceae sp. PMI808]
MNSSLISGISSLKADSSHDDEFANTLKDTEAGYGRIIESLKSLKSENDQLRSENNLLRLKSARKIAQLQKSTAKTIISHKHRLDDARTANTILQAELKSAHDRTVVFNDARRADNLQMVRLYTELAALREELTVRQAAKEALDVQLTAERVKHQSCQALYRDFMSSTEGMAVSFLRHLRHLEIHLPDYKSQVQEPDSEDGFGDHNIPVSIRVIRFLDKIEELKNQDALKGIEVEGAAVAELLPA